MIFLGTVLAAIAQPALQVSQRPESVVVERIAARRWRATYRLARPTRTLTFDRPAAFYRERVWTITTPGYALRRDGDSQILTTAPGAQAQRTIVLEFPEYSANIPKEYQLFQPFTDGAVAIYTGHFIAQAEDRAPIRTITIVPPPGAHAILRGTVTRGPQTWTDSTGEGTYVYLGTARPIETPDLVAVVDPGMPAWLRQLFDTSLPALFATYRERFDQALPWKPVVLYSFDPDSTPGRSSGGGTLTGLIQVTLTGADWRHHTPGAEEDAFALLAHEAAHLWNGQLVDAPGGGESWMHEGAADAMAGDLLLAVGVIDSARHRARTESALNECLLDLLDGPVHTAHQRGAFRTFYRCGAVLAWWTELAVQRSAPGADLFTFWRDLVRAARGHQGQYDEALYFATLAANGVPDSIAGAMRAFLDATDGADRVIVPELASLDAPLLASDAPPPDYQGVLVQRAFVHLMSQACGGRINFHMGSPVRTGAVAGCEPFVRPLTVFSVDGKSVAEDGAALYDAVAAACAARRAVALQGEDGATISTVPCRRALRPRPPLYRLGRG